MTTPQPTHAVIDRHAPHVIITRNRVGELLTERSAHSFAAQRNHFDRQGDRYYVVELVADPGGLRLPVDSQRHIEIKLGGADEGVIYDAVHDGEVVDSRWHLAEEIWESLTGKEVEL